MSSGTKLTGIEGTNPLGFLAGLGVQVAFDFELCQPRLWWSDDITPCAIVDREFTVERIADQALIVFDKLSSSYTLNPKQSDGSSMHKSEELKLRNSDIRTYLCKALQDDQDISLSSALVAEGGLDKKGIAKPSDLYFTAGQQKFLAMARMILKSVTKADVIEGLLGPWSYSSKLPSLMWDIVDDRVYALSAENPSKNKKLSNPGPEALALLGMSRHQVFATHDRTLTLGCSGSWKAGNYTWPLWQIPSSASAVSSLVTHASHDRPLETRRHRWYAGWGVISVLRTPIRRSSQGGYGTFGPPEIIWQA